MTNKEFKDYLKSLRKDEFTKEEVYEIGKRYREVVDKNWNWLAIELNWSSGENLRTYVKNKLAKEGKLNKRNNFVEQQEDAIIEQTNASSNNSNDEIEEKLQILYKEQQKYRDIMSSYRRAMREDARLDVMRDAIKECVKELNELKHYNYIGKTKSINNEAVLLLSDLHIGVECDNFYNKYNKDVASQRLNKLVKNTIEYCHRNNVQRLNVLNLGDLIAGLIHTSARVEQEMDVVSQVMVAGELVANTLNELQVAAPQVIYRSVCDNHARVMANYKESIENENFYRLIDWYLMERLRTTNIIFEDDNIDIGLGKFDLLNGKKIMFAHGHQDSINTCFQNWIGATRDFIDYMCLGHYHCSKQKEYQGVKVIVNGSIVGTEQYALSKRLFSKPSQTLLIFENDNLMSINIDLEVI